VLITLVWVAVTGSQRRGARLILKRRGVRRSCVHLLKQVTETDSLVLLKVEFNNFEGLAATDVSVKCRRHSFE
jgi:hypothetical protein